MISWFAVAYLGFVAFVLVTMFVITLWWEKRHPELYGDEAGKQSP